LDVDNLKGLLGGAIRGVFVSAEISTACCE